jgi:hypothetical protein
MSDHPRLLDLRHEQTEANRRDACEYRRGAVVMRDPKAVTAIALHQMAVPFSIAPYQLAASNGDESLARHRRFLGVNAHVSAGRHGRFVVAHDPLVYVNHGHQLNAFSVGLEHEGLYDVNGIPAENTRKLDVGEIIEAGRAAMTWLVEQCPHVTHVYAHRQAMRAPKGAKAADPGARIFREVGVEHGVRKLGLKIEPDRAWGTGKALPSNWYR